MNNQEEIIDLRGKSDKQIDEMLLVYLAKDLKEIGEINHEKK
jgi:hypothetical protein